MAPLAASNDFSAVQLQRCSKSTDSSHLELSSHRYSLFLAVQLQGTLSYRPIRLSSYIQTHTVLHLGGTQSLLSSSTAEMFDINRIFASRTFLPSIFFVSSGSIARNIKLLPSSCVSLHSPALRSSILYFGGSFGGNQ